VDFHAIVSGRQDLEFAFMMATNRGHRLILDSITQRFNDVTAENEWLLLSVRFM
jgi:hypothetical protein